MGKLKNNSKPKFRYDEISDDDYVDLNKEVVLLPNGVRVTNEMVQKWADAAETTTLGRPSLSGKQEISPEIKARVPKPIKDKLVQLAEKQGLTLSTVIRLALYEYIQVNKSDAIGSEYIHWEQVKRDLGFAE